jgi:hypothetical protein
MKSNAKRRLKKEYRKRLKFFQYEREVQKARDVRRIRLIALLCKSRIGFLKEAITDFASPEDLKSFNSQFNKPGASAYATLPDLMRSGNPIAVSLALYVARGINDKRETHHRQRPIHRYTKPCDNRKVWDNPLFACMAYRHALRMLGNTSPQQNKEAGKGRRRFLTEDGNLQIPTTHHRS